jgi:hypothetical protein
MSTYCINFPHCGCNSGCGCSGNRNQGIYGTNMWNVNGNTPGNQYTCGHQQACNGCIDIIKDICVLYLGSNLTNTGINQNDTLRTILAKLDALFAIQATKNANILAALNDINDRLNVVETENATPGGGSHPPYTLL